MNKSMWRDSGVRDSRLSCQVESKNLLEPERRNDGAMRFAFVAVGRKSDHRRSVDFRYW
jgi:hypothetical protein